MKRFENYLGNIDHLVSSSPKGEKKGDDYIHPALKNMGSVTIIVIREAIAPVVFRNEEQEITDIEIGEEAYVRAVPNKFKYPEKGRGLQILRAYGVGGRLPQNKTFLRKSEKPSDAFDMNTLVFGDSTMHDNRVLPVRAAVNYSDGLSLLPKHLCVDETFHNRAMEDGTLFDAETGENSVSLFSRHFITPGTLMVQVLSTRGKVLPSEGLDHLLLSMGIAGLYGGQTSTTGVNIRSRIAGVYGAKFERAETSPYEIVKSLRDTDVDKKDGDAVIQAIHTMMAEVHEASMDAEAVGDYQKTLVEQFEKDDPALTEKYEQAAPKVAELFDSWFGTGKKK
ncbi:type I-D CRISPR-associated protein Cas7/Csc2 [Desulfonema magnum]|uniref:CRISPR-associated protein, Csc2 n=1 Tax=Desulfonema magnum TaxID=45655 RepID=A0A975BMI5_9BACT|nr:type I-D CRISPR-associated protein Cas7/Csc2 [Desulfonema magnum]QTA88206.1 CRISPR-associated protein, Csc2 [Desulfonema magnum]